MPSSRRVWITLMSLSLDHQHTSLTGYSAFLTQWLDSSPVPGSMTVASHLCCMVTYTGLTFYRVFSSSWASQCTVAYRIRFRFTWWAAVVESRTLSVCAIYDQRVNTIWLYHVTGSQIVLTLLAEYLWSSGLLFCWLSNLELSTRQPPWPGALWWQF